LIFKHLSCILSHIIIDIIPVSGYTPVTGWSNYWGAKKGEHMNWYLEVLKKYTEFNGRARRKEYWMFVLFNILIMIVLLIIDKVIGTYSMKSGVGLLQVIYSLAVLIPGLAVTVRRLHDSGKSGWWILIGLVPFVGGIVLLIFMVLESQAGDNEYGAYPK